MKKKLITLFVGLFTALSAVTLMHFNSEIKEVKAKYTQTASEYYSAIDWDETGADLKTSLFTKIKIDKAGWTYDGLWTAYQTTDVKANGKLWDIYSDLTNYTIGGSAQGANYSKEGDAYNREHMIPQSIFNEQSPMVSDAHHVLPSDGYVNNMRSNHPHGNVTSATYTSNDGYKLGTGSATGSTTVFEPKDCYKGDIARIYFYFVTCYQDKLSSFDTYEAFTKDTYPSISTTYLNIYLQWAKDDPVSQKEIDRNRIVYETQGNRNPFVDSPYAIGAIWDSTHASDYGTKGQYTDGSGPTDGITISKESASLGISSTTKISATTTDSSDVSWSFSPTGVAKLNKYSSTSGDELTITGQSAGTTTLTASATIGGESYTATCSIEVTKSVTSISISGYRTSFVEGDSFTYGGTVTANYDDGTTSNVTSQSSFSGYNMTSLGSQTVTVSYSGKTKTYTITIGAGTPVSLSLSGQTTSYQTGASFSFDGTATVTFANNYQKNVTPTSVSSPDMSTEGNKTVTVSYTYNSVTVSNNYTINVSDTTYYEKVTSTSDVTAGDYLIVYETGNLAFNGGLETLDATSNTISVTINNSKIVSNSTTDAAKFTLAAVTGGFSIKSASDYYVGRTSDSNGMNTSTSTAYANTITISSGDADIVSSGAYLRYNKTSGQERFRYFKSSTYTSQEAVQLYKKSSSSPTPVAVTGVELDNEEIEINVGETKSLVATVLPADATNKNVTWSSDDETVATVDNGTVTGVAAGTATITVTTVDGGFTATCDVTVNGSVEPTTGDANFVASEQGYTDTQSVASASFDNTNVSVVFNKGTGNNDPKYYNSGASIRVYAKGYFTVSSSKANITGIALTFGSGEGSNTITVDKGDYDSGEWTPNPSTTFAQSVTFSIGGTSGHRRIAAIAVSYYSGTDFANDFLDGTGCNSKGTSAPTVNWTTMSNKFDILFTEDQNAFKIATGSETGTKIEQAVARYDYILNKYGKTAYPDFMKRNLSSYAGINRIAMSVLKQDSSTVLIVAIVFTSTALAVGGYFFLRKRKED